MEEKSCSSCTFFYQHYGINEKRIFRLHCGHCVRQRTRSRRPDRKACEFYIAAEQKETFVSREYLTYALLNYITKMELLPEILELSDQR